MMRYVVKTCCLLTTLTVFYIVWLPIPFPNFKQTIRVSDIIKELEKEEEGRSVSREHMQEYCKTALNSPYNYATDQFNTSVKNDYYANIEYFASHLYINDELKFMYLAVPKVACSNWKRLLLQLNNVTNPGKLDWPHNFGDFRRLTDIPRTEWHSVLNEYGYFKFVFVRNPWIRLVSAYVDRFTRHDKWWYASIQQFEGKRMIKNHRVNLKMNETANASEEEIRSGKDVTFREFVLDILDHQSKAPNNVTTKQNEHWNAQFFIAGLCHPWVKFDLIARYEDLGVQSQYIFNKVGIREFESFPAPVRNSSTEIRAVKEYSALDPTLLQRLSIQVNADMRMLGYSVPEGLVGIVPGV